MLRSIVRCLPDEDGNELKVQVSTEVTFPEAATAEKEEGQNAILGTEAVDLFSKEEAGPFLSNFFLPFHVVAKVPRRTTAAAEGKTESGLLCSSMKRKATRKKSRFFYRGGFLPRDFEFS